MTRGTADDTLGTRKPSGWLSIRWTNAEDREANLHWRHVAESRYLFYSNSWQVLEERLSSSTNAERQFIWGLRYIDDILLRDRDTDGSGTLNERLFGLQDSNWNLTAFADVTGAVQERYSYDAYGMADVLSPGFLARTATLYDWDVRFAGYRWDQASELYQVRNRVLHPLVGWASRDQLVFMESSNLYLYVENCPLTYTDPFGQYKACCSFDDGSQIWSEEVECTATKKVKHQVHDRTWIGHDPVQGDPCRCCNRRAVGWGWGTKWKVLSAKPGRCWNGSPPPTAPHLRPRLVQAWLVRLLGLLCGCLESCCRNNGSGICNRRASLRSSSDRAKHQPSPFGQKKGFAISRSQSQTRYLDWEDRSGLHTC